MKRLLFCLLPILAYAHPGIGIVKDSKGIIYYSDLQQVWKIENGLKTIAVPGVHSHELYMDSADNLYGEHVIYKDEGANVFQHYLWVLKSNGSFDTVLGPKQAYLLDDYSLARDRNGAEYFMKRFPRQIDTTHLYKRWPDGRETVFATGNFKGITWLHPQGDGSLLYILNNNVYRVSPAGGVTCLAKGIGNTKPSFAFSKNNITTWGAWEDTAKNVYVAVFSDQTVRKIDSAGNISDYYRSAGHWTPIHGVFDNAGQLWVLESSDINEVRVVQAGALLQKGLTMHKAPWLIVGFGILALAGLWFWKQKPSRKRLLL